MEFYLQGLSKESTGRGEKFSGYWKRHIQYNVTPSSFMLVLKRDMYCLLCLLPLARVAVTLGMDII